MTNVHEVVKFYFCEVSESELRCPSLLGIISRTLAHALFFSMQFLWADDSFFIGPVRHRRQRLLTAA